MKRISRIIPAVIVGLLLAATAAVLTVTKNEAYNLLHAPMESRNLPEKTPADFNLPFEDVQVISADGTKLVGWFVPSQNGAVILMQHGYKSDREEMLNEAEMMYRHGYGVLLTTVRAHDYSEGELITFGIHEVDDMDAWYRYLLTRSDIDPERIGILGNS